LPAGALLGGAAVVAGVALVVSEAPRSSTTDRRKRRLGMLCAGTAAISQAIGIVIGHAAMQGADVMGGTLVRTGGGIVGAFAIAAGIGLVPRRRVVGELSQLVRPWWDRDARRGLFVAAIFGSIVALPLFHYALRSLESGVAAVLFATTPLFTLPLGAAMGERHGLRAVLGALVGFAGVAAVVLAVT
jgi:drug/metabolite transporter (DMT)-like permease